MSASQTLMSASMLRKPSGSLNTSTCQQLRQKEVRGSNSRDPSPVELPNTRCGIFSFPRLSPPPHRQSQLNWVRPCKCGGCKAEIPQPFLCSLAHGQKCYFTLQTGTSAQLFNTVRLLVHKNAQSEASSAPLCPLRRLFIMYEET